MASRRSSHSRSRGRADGSGRPVSPGRAVSPGRPAASGRAGGATAEAAGGRRPQLDRDGRATIGCPNCGAKYKILEDHLEEKVKCGQCQRTFFPLAAAKSRRAPKDHSKAIIYMIVGLVAIVAIGILIFQTSAPEPERAPPTVAEKEPETGNDAPEVKAASAWAKAVQNHDGLNAALFSDLDAIQTKLGVAADNPISRTVGDMRSELERQILDKLYKADETLVFRSFAPSYGRIENPDMVARKRGRVLLTLYPVDSKLNTESARVWIDYRFDQARDRFVVAGWEVDYIPSIVLRGAGIEQPGQAKKHKQHDLIEKPKVSTTSFAGEQVTIREAELVPLPHLETTSAEDRKKIDDLIEQMIDINAAGANFNRSSRALEKFGKAAVPRVLNKMYEVKLKTRDDVLIVNRLARFLRDLSGWQFGFNHADAEEGTDVGGTEKERISALKQWYAWWADYHDRDDWELKDADDELFLTQDQIDAKRKAEAEARKKEREAQAARRKAK